MSISVTNYLTLIFLFFFVFHHVVFYFSVYKGALVGRVKLTLYRQIQTAEQRTSI